MQVINQPGISERVLTGQGLYRHGKGKVKSTVWPRDHATLGAEPTLHTALQLRVPVKRMRREAAASKLDSGRIMIQVHPNPTVPMQTRRRGVITDGPNADQQPRRQHRPKFPRGSGGLLGRRHRRDSSWSCQWPCFGCFGGKHSPKPSQGPDLRASERLSPSQASPAARAQTEPGPKNLLETSPA